MINNYIEKELFAACPIPPAECDDLKIQMRSARGSSKWLTITPGEWKSIEDILLKRYDEGQSRGFGK